MPLINIGDTVRFNNLALAYLDENYNRSYYNIILTENMVVVDEWEENIHTDDWDGDDDDEDILYREQYYRLIMPVNIERDSPRGLLVPEHNYEVIVISSIIELVSRGVVLTESKTSGFKKFQQAQDM